MMSAWWFPFHYPRKQINSLLALCLQSSQELSPSTIPILEKEKKENPAKQTCIGNQLRNVKKIRHSLQFLYFLTDA